MKASVKTLLNKVLLKFAQHYKPIDMLQYYCHGDRRKLHLGQHVSTVNTIFNVASGHVYVGDNTIFGHNCMLVTGRHEFVQGRRKKLAVGGPEAPKEGFDIRIGNGCWIASGAIIIGGVTIGNDVIVGAGSVVTKDVPSRVFVAGVPARIEKELK